MPAERSGGGVHPRGMKRVDFYSIGEESQKRNGIITTHKWIGQSYPVVTSVLVRTERTIRVGRRHGVGVGPGRHLLSVTRGGDTRNPSCHSHTTNSTVERGRGQRFSDRRQPWSGKIDRLHSTERSLLRCQRKSKVPGRLPVP